MSVGLHSAEGTSVARAEKVAEVEEIAGHLADSAATLLTDYRGLSVGELADLRTRLRDAGATYRVVKNTLTLRAAEQVGMEGLDEFLVGPTALVFCADEPVAPARAVASFAESHEDLSVKAGWLDGEVLDREATLHLATLRTREELLTSLVGMMDGALSGFARLMQAKLVDTARLLRALEDEGGPAGGGAAGPGSDDGEATPDEATSDEATAAGTDPDEAGEDDHEPDGDDEGDGDDGADGADTDEADTDESAEARSE